MKKGKEKGGEGVKERKGVGRERGQVRRRKEILRSSNNKNGMLR